MPSYKSITPKKEKLTLINIKVSEEDRKLLMSQAKRYADGNLSAWLRYAGIHYVPFSVPKKR